MTEQEKSVMLARLCGWQVETKPSSFAPDSTVAFVYNSNGEPIMRDTLTGNESMLDLYRPGYMTLAWKCIEWVTTPPKTLEMAGAALNARFAYWWDANHLWAETAADAQRLWLDKILSLAIEAGLVEKEPALNG